MIEGTKLVLIKVSNGKGQCNFSGQRYRSSFIDIVPGTWDNGTSSKCCLGTGWDGILTFCHGTGRDGILTTCPVPGQDVGQKGKKNNKIKNVEKKNLRIFYFF